MGLVTGRAVGSAEAPLALVRACEDDPLTAHPPVAVPENTLASFEAAIRDGAEGIETGKFSLFLRLGPWRCRLAPRVVAAMSSATSSSVTSPALPTPPTRLHPPSHLGRRRAHHQGPRDCHVPRPSPRPHDQRHRSPPDAQLPRRARPAPHQQAPSPEDPNLPRDDGAPHAQGEPALLPKHRRQSRQRARAAIHLDQGDCVELRPVGDAPGAEAGAGVVAPQVPRARQAAPASAVEGPYRDEPQPGAQVLLERLPELQHELRLPRRRRRREVPQRVQGCRQGVHGLDGNSPSSFLLPLSSFRFQY